MAKREHRRNEYGFDVPVHRDWLFWSVLPIAAMLAEAADDVQPVRIPGERR